jgi:hypothetical protein
MLHKFFDFQLWLQEVITFCIYVNKHIHLLQGGGKIPGWERYFTVRKALQKTNKNIFFFLEMIVTNNSILKRDFFKLCGFFYLKFPA